VNLVRESIHFERGGDAREKMGIGLGIKNPMPRLNSYIENELKDPMDFNFADLNEQMDIARRELMDMILIKGLHQEYGPGISYEGRDSYSRITFAFNGQKDGSPIEFFLKLNASNDYISYTGYFELKDGNMAGWDGPSYSRSVNALIKKLNRTFKKEGITI
jgi:hypothetical protein